MQAVDATWRSRFISRGSQLAEWVQAVYGRHGRTLWMLHSAWALLTGVAVLVLAHNRYGFLPWVVMFLALTWASTLFFSRFADRLRWRRAQLARGFVSYLTRVMYQETLFFLLPFYFYSTTFPSWNSAFVVLLAALAVLSCFDLLFDRWLRSSPAFAFGFFALVSFSALQFFLPLVFGARIHHGAYLAAVLSFLAALPLAVSSTGVPRGRRALRVALALLLVLVAARALRPAFPPVPLRLAKVRFATTLEPRTLRIPTEYETTIPAAALTDRLFAVATIFSPSQVPTSISLRFLRDGRLMRSSRTVELVAHPRGFRVWDLVKAPEGGFPPGPYTLEVWTGEGQLVGRRHLTITP